MIKIVVLTNGISIGGVSFPNNSLIFETENKDIVQIFLATNHHKVFSAHYTQYQNSTDQLYASSQAVITDLLLNNKASGGGGGSGDLKADGSVPMTGPLTLSGDPVNPLNPVTKQLFDSTIASVNSDITNIKNYESKVLYYEEINNSTGTITKPANTVIFLNDFPQGYDAVVETIVNGEPTGQIAKTSGGTPITVTSFDTSGNYTLSGTPSSFPVALLYILRVKALYMSNLTFDNIIESGNFSVGNASDVVFTPNGDIAATDVQSAIVEVRDDTDIKLISKQNRENYIQLSEVNTFRAMFNY